MPKSYATVAPCKGCEKRRVGCHATCKEYAIWKNAGIEIIEPFYDNKKGRKRRR